MRTKVLLRALFLLAILAGSSATLSACNTVRGFGQDVEAAGEGMQGASEDVQGY